MKGIADLSLHLSNKLGQKLQKNETEIEVLNYGLFSVLHTILTVILIVICGIALGIMLEVSIITICSAIMKRYSGGVHASSAERCSVISIIVCICMALIAKTCTEIMATKLVFISLSIGFIISYIVLYEKCPIPSKNKPLKKESTRKKMRKKAFNLLNAYLVIVFMLGIIYWVNGDYLIKNIMICILFGVLTQMFALSSVGGRIIRMIDILLGGK